MRIYLLVASAMTYVVMVAVLWLFAVHVYITRGSTPAEGWVVGAVFMSLIGIVGGIIAAFNLPEDFPS